MRKFFFVLLILLLLVGPMISSGLAIADSIAGFSETSTEENLMDSSSKNDGLSNGAESSTSEEYSETVVGGLEGEGNESETQLSEEQLEEVDTPAEQAKVTITFSTDLKYPFVSGDDTVQVIKTVGESLTKSDIPKLTDSSKFVGWTLNGVVVSEQELLAIDLIQDLDLQAQYTKTRLLTASATSYSDTSVIDVIKTADSSKVIVVPSPVNSASYAVYDHSSAGLQKALFDMYQNGNNQEFVLYIGSGTLSLPATVTAKNIPATVTSSNITFYALQNKVSRLIITGSANDPITDAVTLTSGSGTLTFLGNVHFGTDIIFRNVNYNGVNWVTNLYMNGHSLSLNGGSTGNNGLVLNTMNIYGGTDSGDVTGNPTLMINATGYGYWNLYGGNENGGTLTGNPTITVNNSVGDIYTIAGGAKVGTVKGNITTTITKINGTVSYFYGGGVGASTSQTANVTGKISTTIAIDSSAKNFRLASYYGGVLYGDIQGSITNDVSGSGGWIDMPWEVLARGKFIGGSGSGNITASSGTSAITSHLDVSQYTTYGPDFIGANRYSGTIVGDIKNIVKAGTGPLQGGIGDFDGGGGYDAVKMTKDSLGASDEATYDGYSSTHRAQLAYNAATYRIVGNIDSHLEGGSFGNNNAWRTTAAGTGGYVEGNVTIEVGTSNADGLFGGAGMVYSGEQIKASDLYYSNERNDFANDPKNGSKEFDIAAGGYVDLTDTVLATSNNWPIYINGDTHTIINNAVARRTYGGVFGGVVEGNTNITLNSGIVDTLEGGGYNSGRIYGNASAVVNDGQVDWFLTGGGWYDKKIVGNVSVTVNDGMINASMGGSYGFYSDHTITGDSSVVVKGGNFSGKTRDGNNGFSAGVTHKGSILGNATLTLDLRNSEEKFVLPEGTNISGGRPPGVDTTLGTNQNNTITLNIYTAEGSNVLNGAAIYGDGGPTDTTGNGKSGKIVMNIEAPESTIGTLYATNYPNISNNEILKDVTINVQRAKAIGGISGGNGNTKSNLTNEIVKISNRKIQMNFGVKVGEKENSQTESISITGLGIVNFTELNVTDNVKLLADGGDIKNGMSATAANHSSTYNQFGDINLSNNGGIGISSSKNIISGATLNVEGEATVESPPGTGKVNISDFNAGNADLDHLLWIKNTENDAKEMVSTKGTTFGATSAYQVLTVNPTKDNASKIQPINFSGIEKATGKTFIGDNDVTKSGSGYGVAIAGSIIEYEVEKPIAYGTGSITHNVTDVKKDNQPLTLTAWGTDIANVEVQAGRLFIPYDASREGTTLTFTPETEKTGSWIYSRVIETSKAGATSEQIAEQPNSDPIDWKSPSGEYSYSIKVKYSNKAELTANNIVYTEQEVASLTESQLLADINAKGRPFFKTDFTDESVTLIQQPLGEDLYRKYSFTFDAGTVDDNQRHETINIVVVNDESSLAEDRSFAVYAKSARLNLNEANALADESALAEYTLATTIFADNRENAIPTVSPTAFTAIQKVTEEELLKNVSTEYSFKENEQTAAKTVNVAITGELKLVSVPKTFDFSTQKIATTTQTYWPNIEEDLVVKDTRGDENNSWSLTVREEQALTNGTDTLANSLIFVANSQEYVLNGSDLTIEEKQSDTNGSYIVNENWSEENSTGIKLAVPVEKQKVGEYAGILSWQLVSAPTNP